MGTAETERAGKWREKREKRRVRKGREGRRARRGKDATRKTSYELRERVLILLLSLPLLAADNMAQHRR